MVPGPLRRACLLGALATSTAWAQAPQREPQRELQPAPEPERSIAQLAHETWGAKDGLPEGPVFAVHETADGFLWLGTIAGLVRFDGERFIVFEAGRLGLEHYSHVRDLVETADGALYAGVVGGVARYDRGRFAFYGERAGIEHPFVYALAAGSPGAVWVGTGGSGVWQLRDGTLTRHRAYLEDSSLPAQVNDLATDALGTLWVATDHGVVALGRNVRRYSTEAGLPSSVVRAIAFDRDGTLWVGTRRGLGQLLPSGRFRTFTTKDGLSDDDVSALCGSRDGTLWIGTHEGSLNRFVGGRIEPAAPGSARANGGIVTLAEDRAGALWVGTGQGLERYRSGAVVTAGRSEGLGNEEILNVLARRAGGLWMLDGAGALLVYENGRARLAAKEGTIAGEGMLGLAESADGSLWIGGQALHRFQDGVWTSYAHPGGEVTVIAPDGGGLLVAQTAGDGTSTLARFVDGRFEPFPTAVRLIHVQRLYRDRRGQLWISTGGAGLVRIGPDGGTRAFRARDGLPHDVVYGIEEDGGGDLWVATRGGLARIRGDRVDNLAGVANLPARAPLQLQLDRLGYLWVTADDGIFRMALRDLAAAADGNARAVPVRRFTIADGLRSLEISWRCSGQARTPDGRLWYATARGLSLIDPSAVERPSDPPPVLIDDLVAGGRRAELGGGVAIGPGRERVEIRYTAPSLANPDDLEFRYRLAGYDADWVEAKARRVAYYTGLPAGGYTFRVAARRGDGAWGEAPAELAVQILPRWNETALARLLFVLGAALILLGVYRFRVRTMRVQKQALVRRVAERTAELRAEVTERRNAEEEVRRLNAELEARVRDRTSALEQANLALAADVAARQRTEAALADEKEKLSVTLRSIAEGVVTVDVEGRILMMNPVAERLTGWATEQAAGRPVGEVFPVSDRWSRGPLRSDPVTAVLSGRQVGSGEITRALLALRDGRQILVDASAAPIHERRGLVVGAVVVFRDVTEKTRADEQIQKTQKLEAVGILAGGIAHDFNNLLTGIFGHVDLARAALPGGSPALRWLDDVLDALENARSLAGQLLTFASGGAPARESHSLRELLDRSARFVLSGSGVSVELAVPDDLRRCDIDPLQIRQVVDNIVLNARQALPHGGHVEIAARNVELAAGDRRALPPGPYVEITIRDDGAGIPEAIREQVFDPFFTTKSGGTGLGLATVRSIVAQHGGVVDFSSAPDAGTTFRVLLRATDAAATDAAAPSPAPPPGATAARGHGRILVMDDEQQIRNLLKVGLELEGYEVEASSQGSEALAAHDRARAEGRPFDLVILDLTVAGGMGGIDTLAQLRATDPGLRAIASSGYSSDETMSDPRAAGFDGILPKPYKLTDLATIVARVLQSSRRPATEPGAGGPATVTGSAV
jgi:PAS domain S-box-containing protein